VVQQEKQYSWQLLNMRIARKEFAVSGAEFNHAVRDRKFLKFIGQVLFGSRALIQEFVDNCPDVVTAGSIPDLAKAMNDLTGTSDVDPAVLAREVEAYDRHVRMGDKHNDDQRRRIAHARLYRGDRLRTSKAALINDPEGLPLIAFHERIVTRKSLGGLQTDLEGRVLGEGGEPLAGLYAAGEAAGFGGGGIHGLRSLEGTFLGGCIFTGRAAARALISGKSPAKA
jgi:predicted oxidoreductase